MTMLVKETRYGENFRALILSPHGSEGTRFFELFPEILADEQVAKQKESFLAYVELEKDSGATELCHKIAQELLSQGVSSKVVELDYPRAIVDGGRILEKCLRNALPRDLEESLQSRFLDMHQKSLNRLLELYKELNQNNGLILDVHTMASFCPVNHGAKLTKPISFETMESYKKQYINAPRDLDNLRYFDLITADTRGEELGDKKLKMNIEQMLIENNISYKMNKPYAASDEFLMYPNLTHCRGLCFDIPKHSLTKYHSHPENFDVSAIELDDGQLSLYASVLSEAFVQSLDLP